MRAGIFASAANPSGYAASRDWALMADWFDESYLRSVI